MPNHIIVHKFGGTSLADASRYAAVAQMTQGKDEIIVVSAMQGVTRTLSALLHMAASHQPYEETLEKLYEQHVATIRELIKKPKELLGVIENDVSELRDLLHSVGLVGSYERVIEDRVLGYGERWSAQMLAGHLAERRKVAYLDATQVLFSFIQHGIQEIDWEKSAKALESYWAEHKLDSYDQVVATGFIVSDEKNRQTTLGANGSDFSAAILAKLMNASEIIIWTDVDGIMSADPNKVASAFVLESVSYQEALELAYFGATVLHPRTIEPAIDKHIPVYIKNSFNPDAKGTCISASPEASPHLIRGLSCIDEVALLNVEGPGMVGVTGIVSRLFHELGRVGISIILISQGSSEHSICFAIQRAQADLAIATLEQYFQYELREGVIRRIYADKDCAILAAVGENMIGVPGIIARLGQSLSGANVSIRALAQGSSELNVSIVVKQEDVNKGLRAVHSGFYLSNKSISVGVIGPGLVGGTLLKQINDAAELLAEHYQTSIFVRGITNSRKMLLHDRMIDLTTYTDQLADSSVEADLDRFVEHIVADDIPHAVIIDCTASSVVADRYVDFINKGVHIITPNKCANAGDLDIYRQLKQACRAHNRHYLYEATVCAGLPIIKSLQDLIQTGDEVLSIEGIVSGTLAYIFSHLGKGKSFSEVVKDAQRLGYTEPDPREDLSGMDVARKCVCLAREIGLPATLDQVKLHDLVPKPLRKGSKENFMSKLADYDDDMQATFSDIANNSHKLHYVGRIMPDGVIDVDIKPYAGDHPFAHLKGTDNMIVFRTKRYDEQPMVIRGPGAGAEVTAGGVFADLMRLISIL